MTHIPTAPAPASAPPEESPWAVLALLTAATTWTVTVEMLPSALLPAMSADLGVSEGAVGLLVSAWAVTIAVVGLPVVRLTARVRRTRLLTIALVVTAAANLVTALAPGYGPAFAGRVLGATAHGLFWALVVAYVAAVVDADRLGRALAVVLSGPTIAGFVGLPVAALVADAVGWRAALVGLSVVIGLTALALWRVLPSGGTDSGEGAGAGAWDGSARRVVAVALAGGLVLVGHFAVFTYIAPLSTGLGGMGTGAVPGLLLVLGAGGAVGVALSAVASDRYPGAAVVVAAALVAGGLVLVRLGGQYPALFVTGVAVWGVAIGAFPPMLQARVLRLSSPGFRPMAGGVVVTVLNLGTAAGAALGGVLLGHGQSTLVVAAVAVAVLGALGLTVRRPHPGSSEVLT